VGKAAPVNLKRIVLFVVMLVCECRNEAREMIHFITTFAHNCPGTGIALLILFVVGVYCECKIEGRLK
jgi:hypothetical protein